MFRHTGTMTAEPQREAWEFETPEREQSHGCEKGPEMLDPQDTDRLRDQIKGQTKEHASPPRLEDEGQSGS